MGAQKDGSFVHPKHVLQLKLMGKKVAVLLKMFANKIIVSLLNPFRTNEIFHNSIYMQ